MVNLQEKSQSANILPPSEVILQKLRLDSKQVKLIKPFEKRSHYRAVINWLTKYHPDPNVTNLEKVRGLLETFDHLCKVEDWKSAKSILMTKLDTLNHDELYWQFRVWGYFREEIQLCQQILGKLDISSDCVWLSALGDCYYRLGAYQEAISFHQQHLTITRKTGSRRSESAALGNLGSVYENLGQYERAIDFHQKALVISREIGDRQSESKDLGNLAIVYKDMGQYEQAIDFYQQSLTIDREIGDRLGEAIALGNMGRAYCALAEGVTR